MESDVDSSGSRQGAVATCCGNDGKCRSSIKGGKFVDERLSACQEGL